MADGPSPPRVVFDANIFVQTLLNRGGAGAACVNQMREAKVTIAVTVSILTEIEKTLIRVSRSPKYKGRVEPNAVSGLMTDLLQLAEIHPEPPRAFRLERDPDDEVYLSLAVATGAALLTTSDRDLLHLMDEASEIGADFRARFPDLLILTPPEFLARMRAKDERPLDPSQ